MSRPESQPPPGPESTPQCGALACVTPARATVPAAAGELGTWTVETAATLAEASRFRGFYERHAWHPESDPHLTFAAHEALGSERSPWLVQVGRDGCPVALLVGQVADVRVPWRVGYKVLHESSFRQLEVLHGGVLGEDSEATARLLFDEVHRFLRGGGADAALLRYVPEGSAVHRIFRARAGWLCRDHVTPVSLHWRLRLPRSFAAFVQGLSKKSREDCKRFASRIHKDFDDDVAVVLLERPDDVAEATRVVEAIARTTYQRGLGAGFRDTVEQRARWRSAAGRGSLRVFVLWLGRTPVAFCTGYETGGTLWLEHVGYDPAFRRYQPGGHLLHRVIERACDERRVQVVDFGVGDADYKRRLCNEATREVSIYVFAPTARGLGLNLLRIGTAVATRCAGALAQRLGLLARVKGWWRRRLARRGAS